MGPKKGKTAPLHGHRQADKPSHGLGRFFPQRSAVQLWEDGGKYLPCISHVETGFEFACEPVSCPKRDTGYQMLNSPGFFHFQKNLRLEMILLPFSG